MTSENPPPPVGVVTGLHLEADCLDSVQQDVRIACSGSSADRAATQAERLIQRGCGALLSFGLAGGLDPCLRPGDLILPSAVVLPGGQRIEVDPDWHDRVRASAQAAGLALSLVPLAGSESVVGSPAAKRQLAHRTGAGAVDMESHRVAAVAHRHGLPFLILRAVGDPADRALPRAALAAVRADGSTDTRAVAASLLRRPWELPDLLRLGTDSQAGFSSLRRAVGLLRAPAFCSG